MGVTRWIHVEAVVAGPLPALLGHQDDVGPDGRVLLLQHLDHCRLLPQVLQLLGVIR